jgi:DNA-binding GntR family transcriptional regulator
LTEDTTFETGTLAEQSYEYLRSEILTNRLTPGVILSEVALAARLGVSRGPVREAIRQLAAQGLVQKRSRRSAVVSALTRDEFLEAYQVRESLEVLAARLAVSRIEEAQLTDLEQLAHAMAHAAREDDVAAFFEANTRFHLLLVESSRNRRLIAMYRTLADEMERYRLPSLMLRGSLRRSITEHRAMVRALRKRDAELAAKLISEHIQVPQRSLAARHETDAHLPGVSC